MGALALDDAGLKCSFHGSIPKMALASSISQHVYIKLDDFGPEKRWAILCKCGLQFNHRAGKFTAGRGGLVGLPGR